jgi:uncharacterized protein DUF5069
MKLPLPRETLGGCIWLPRILAKARLLQRGELLSDYASRFCHPTGTDQCFLNHFGLTRDEILAASNQTEADFMHWFNSRLPNPEEKVAEWNHIAVNLGRPGFPMAERLPIAKQTSYKHIDTKDMTTVFEVLEADEAQSAAS